MDQPPDQAFALRTINITCNYNGPVTPVTKPFFLSTLAPLAVFALAGCGSEPAPTQPAVVPMSAPTTPAMPPPDEASFAAAFAAACPDAETVATSLCKSMGMGETDFTCRYGLGDDNNLRHEATLTPVDGQWTVADAETVCAR